MHRDSNLEADELTQIAFGVKMGTEFTHKLIVKDKKYRPSNFEKGDQLRHLQ